MREISLEPVIHELHKIVLQDLADQLELSAGCLRAIRDQKTKWPRRTTMEKLLPALGLRLEIVYAQ